MSAVLYNITGCVWQLADVDNRHDAVSRQRRSGYQLDSERHFWYNDRLSERSN
jgi:hypothetical protein